MAMMRHTRRLKRPEDPLDRPATSFQAGVSLDDDEVEVHGAAREDVRLTARDWAAGCRVYMPADVIKFWQEHTHEWRVHLTQHLPLAEAGI